MTDRVLCCLTVSLLTGVLYGRYKSLWFLVLLLLLAGSTATVLVCRYWKMPSEEGKRRQGIKTVCCVAAVRSLLCLVLFTAGCLHCRGQQDQFALSERFVLKNSQLTVEGEIEKKQVKETQSVYTLKNTKTTSDGRMYPGGKVLVYTSNSTYQPGNIIKAAGDCEPFRVPRNQGNFNEKQYYQSKNITYKLMARQEQLLSGKENYYAVQLEQLRQYIKGVFSVCLPQKEAGVLANMTLGDKTLLDTELKALYQQAGISHILAISGLHVSLFGMGTLGILRKIGCPRKLSALVAAFVVYSFGILSGMELSTLRALIMFFLAMAAQITGYTYDSVTALAVSGSLQLWENPFILDNAGFLFSYSAVLGVTVVSDILRRQTKRKQDKNQKNTKKKRQKNIWKPVTDTLFVSFCIQLTTLPLSLYFYYEMPSYSVLTNGCILPFMGVLLSLGVVGGIAGLLSIKAAAVVLLPAKWILKGNEVVCRAFLSLPGAALITGKPQLGLLIFYYVVLAACLYFIRRWENRKAVIGILAALLLVITLRDRSGFEIAVLDVGQGDGIYLESRQGQGFFIDGGSSDVKQAGTYRILPFLKYKGVKQIKGWIVTHADADHVNGLMEILESGYRVENLILAQGIVRDEAFEALTEGAKEAGCNILFLKPGQTIESEGMSFTALWPQEPETGQSDRNGASLVLAVRYQSFTGIFTGDIGTQQEEALMESGYLEELNLHGITLYKAAHHGSEYSNSLAFLEALSPEAAVVSCGENNRYGHPGKGAVSRIKGSGAQLFYTMESGQITLRWENTTGWIKGFQN